MRKNGDKEYKKVLSIKIKIQKIPKFFEKLKIHDNSIAKINLEYKLLANLYFKMCTPKEH